MKIDDNGNKISEKIHLPWGLIKQVFLLPIPPQEELLG